MKGGGDRFIRRWSFGEGGRKKSFGRFYRMLLFFLEVFIKRVFCLLSWFCLVVEELVESWVLFFWKSILDDLNVYLG